MDIPLPQGVHSVAEGWPVAPSAPRAEALLRVAHAPTPALQRDRASEAAGLRPLLLHSAVSRVHHAVLQVGRARHLAVHAPAVVAVRSAAVAAVREVASAVADTQAAVAAVRVVASEAAGNRSVLQCS